MYPKLIATDHLVEIRTPQCDAVPPRPMSLRVFEGRIEIEVFGRENLKKGGSIEQPYPTHLDP